MVPSDPWISSLSGLLAWPEPVIRRVGAFRFPLPALPLGFAVHRSNRRLLAPVVGTDPSQPPFTRQPSASHFGPAQGWVNIPGKLLRVHATLLGGPFGSVLLPSLPFRLSGGIDARNPLPLTCATPTAAFPLLAPGRDVLHPFRSPQERGPASAEPILTVRPIVLCSPPRLLVKVP